MNRDRVYEGRRVRVDFVVTVTDFEANAIRQSQLWPEDKYTCCGFGWGYMGGGSKELAYALLLDHYGDPVRAEQYANEFAANVIARLPRDWRLTSNDIHERVNLLREELEPAAAVVEFA